MDERQKANAEIANILKQVDALLKKATEIADRAKVGFSYDGPSYGMGGWYEGNRDLRGNSGYWGNDDYGWSASSQSC